MPSFVTKSITMSVNVATFPANILFHRLVEKQDAVSGFHTGLFAGGGGNFSGDSKLRHVK